LHTWWLALAATSACLPLGVHGSCGDDTGGTCRFLGCNSWRGARCHHGRCRCHSGMCAVHGRCVASPPAPPPPALPPPPETSTTTTSTTCSSGTERSALGCIPVCAHHMSCNGAAECTPGYELANCNTQASGAITAEACHAKCAKGFGGIAKAVCFQAGGSFIFSGCVRPKCHTPTTTESKAVAYNFQTCNTTQGMITEAQCTVACAKSYVAVSQPRASCQVDGSAFGLSGCHPTCSVPQKASSAGYSLDGCDTSHGPILASACRVACASGYSAYWSRYGAAEATCLVGGATFKFSGCARNQCEARPTKGYNLTGCTIENSQKLSAMRPLLETPGCKVSCAAGYIGHASAHCANNFAYFEFSGCEPKDLI